jgi:hypothetical protein
MIGEPLFFLLCFVAGFLLGHGTGWIWGQKAMMPIIDDYKKIIASYQKQLRNWYVTVENLMEE